MDNKRILVLSPHTDDGELGCGGTIAKFIGDGSDVFYATFSICEKSLSKECPSDILKDEVQKATKVLGIKKSNLKIFDYVVREFSYRRQDILEDMILLKKEISPDIVLMPSPNDTHQDHKTVSEETLRAFKMSATLLGYEQPWNHVTFNTTAFVKLSEKHIAKKIKALKEYASQKDRIYFKEEFIRSLATIRGTQISSKYAECFEVIRWIM